MDLPHALRGVAVAGLLAGLMGWLVGCEGTTSGREVANIELQPAAERGAYAPVKFNLTTDMNPVAVNFRGDFTQEPGEFGKWNSYKASLTLNGSMVATRNFNVNHPQSNAQGDAPPPAGMMHTLFITDLQSSGEYELTITPLKSAAITIKNARADVRANVQRPPHSAARSYTVKTVVESPSANAGLAPSTNK
ncbi:MAG TPA: hypothetical protein VK642_04320 [Burkholderiales bacterium]|nr:hypothetical protein [Burkholderiales bacterium]